MKRKQEMGITNSTMPFGSLRAFIGWIPLTFVLADEEKWDGTVASVLGFHMGGIQELTIPVCARPL
jgi:hypothetical protein